jgi:hypothetical protein
MVLSGSSWVGVGMAYSRARGPLRAPDLTLSPVATSRNRRCPEVRVLTT